MNDHWKQWEGRVVNGEIPLVRFLGASEHSSVFLADKSAGGKPQTAIKFIPAASVDANHQLRQWKAAADLDHPNAIRIFESGRCEMDGTDFLYVLMEYAEEDLSQIVTQRPLNEEEARQVLDGVLKGLAYFHGQGLVHGRVKPSNILASGDVVKISSDSVSAAGEPKRQVEKTAYDAPEAATGRLGLAADVWSLGVTLVEMLTQRVPVLESAQGQMSLPAGISGPLQEIAGRCLQIDPGGRWTVEEIAARLGTVEAARPQAVREEAATSAADDQKKSAKWVYAVLLAAAIVIAAVFIMKPGPPGSSTGTRTGVSAPHEPASGPESSSGSETRAGMPAPHLDSGGDVLERVMPRVSAGAQNTIKGTIRITVKVDVDTGGNVTEAHLQGAGQNLSKYFARLAVEAARDWKFKPAVSNGQSVASAWVVRFVLRRHGIEASAERTRP